MTTGDERAAATEQLKEALEAEAEDAKNFHVREAIQLLYIEANAASASGDGVNETAN